LKLQSLNIHTKNGNEEGKMKKEVENVGSGSKCAERLQRRVQILRQEPQDGQVLGGRRNSQVSNISEGIGNPV
jgi:hypothetical protein